jgi:hypothetical protein
MFSRKICGVGQAYKHVQGLNSLLNCDFAARKPNQAANSAYCCKYFEKQIDFLFFNVYFT